MNIDWIFAEGETVANHIIQFLINLPRGVVVIIVIAFTVWLWSTVEKD